MHTRAACYPVSYKPTAKDSFEAWDLMLIVNMTCQCQLHDHRSRNLTSASTLISCRASECKVGLEHVRTIPSRSDCSTRCRTFIKSWSIDRIAASYDEHARIWRFEWGTLRTEGPHLAHWGDGLSTSKQQPTRPLDTSNYIMYVMRFHVFTIIFLFRSVLPPSQFSLKMRTRTYCCYSFKSGKQIS
jgi:hypothetical protein